MRYGMLAEADELLGELPNRQAIVDDAASIALRGIPPNFADVGSWANVMPPASLMALSPSVPSDAVPERTMPIARLPRSAARDAKEEVDRQMLRLRVVRPWLQREQPASKAKARIRRDDVDVAGLDAHALGGLLHGHLRRLGQSLAQEARVRRVQMLDQHERHPGVPGADVTEELENASSPRPTHRRRRWEGGPDEGLGLSRSMVAAVARSTGAGRLSADGAASAFVFFTTSILAPARQLRAPPCPLHSRASPFRCCVGPRKDPKVDRARYTPLHPHHTPNLRKVNRHRRRPPELAGRRRPSAFALALQKIASRAPAGRQPLRAAEVVGRAPPFEVALRSRAKLSRYRSAGP